MYPSPDEKNGRLYCYNLSYTDKDGVTHTNERDRWFASDREVEAYARMMYWQDLKYYQVPENESDAEIEDM